MIPEMRWAMKWRFCFSMCNVFCNAYIFTYSIAHFSPVWLLFVLAWNLIHNQYLGIDSTHLWNCIGGVEHHYSQRYSLSWCSGGGERCLKHQSNVSHRCTIRLRTGDCEGRSLWFTPFSFSSNCWVSPVALWKGACHSARDHSHQDRTVSS